MIHSKQLITNSPCFCPNCKKKLDGYTGNAPMPTENDFSVCIYCAEILQFQGKAMNLTLVTVSRETLERLKIENPDTLSQIFCMRTVILKHIN